MITKMDKTVIFVLLLYVTVMYREALLAGHNESCKCHDDCYDFRMVCSNKTALCECSSIYFWRVSENGSECIMNLTAIKLWLAALASERQIRDELDEEARNMFFKLGLAGIVAIGLGAVGTLFCCVFFCFNFFDC